MSHQLAAHGEQGLTSATILAWFVWVFALHDDYLAPVSYRGVCVVIYSLYVCQALHIAVYHYSGRPAW